MNETELAPILITATLKVGAVYRFINIDEDFKSDEPHYYVVLNNPDDTDQLILLACASSKIGEIQMFAVKRNLPGNTVVRVGPSEYSPFTRDTIFNCNNPWVYPRAFLEQLIIDKNMTSATLPTMPDEIVAKLQEGVISSPLVETVKKNLIRKGLI